MAEYHTYGLNVTCRLEMMLFCVYR